MTRANERKGAYILIACLRRVLPQKRTRQGRAWNTNGRRTCSLRSNLGRNGEPWRSKVLTIMSKTPKLKNSGKLLVSILTIPADRYESYRTLCYSCWCSVLVQKYAPRKQRKQLFANAPNKRRLLRRSVVNLLNVCSIIDRFQDSFRGGSKAHFNVVCTRAPSFISITNWTALFFIVTDIHVSLILFIRIEMQYCMWSEPKTNTNT